jgi:hypothetical protein
MVARDFLARVAIEYASSLGRQYQQKVAVFPVANLLQPTDCPSGEVYLRRGHLNIMVVECAHRYSITLASSVVKDFGCNVRWRHRIRSAADKNQLAPHCCGAGWADTVSALNKEG